ncbi:MAG: ABC transporter ATP-binding protein [Zavarzinia sp.]|nr:ABC transporter ATP-binding protein [Zavarzinia sp.]
MALELSGVAAGYVPGVDILRGLSLTATPGEIVTIIGPNGSGKSTCLKVASGYLLPHTGTVTVDGEAVQTRPVDQRVRRNGIAIVPQSNNVFGALTVWENLDLGGGFLPSAERRQRMDELIDAYPLLGRKRREKAYTLSGGERQVLALARALMPSPRYLLLDEPSAGLSPLMLHEVFLAVREIVRKLGIAVLLVEQNAAEALAISDRAYVLVLGQVALEGSAETVLADDQIRQLYLGGAAV